jgi:hypothetical protein
MTYADLAIRDAWLARINAHLGAGEQIDESDVSPVDTSEEGSAL